MSEDEVNQSDQKATQAESKVTTFDPAFPASWGWNAYEPAFAQLFDRVAYELRAPAPHGEGFHDGENINHFNYQRIVLMDWWQSQIEQDNLPSRNVSFTPKGIELDTIFEARVIAAMERQDRDEVALEEHGRNPNPMDRHNPASREWTPINEDHQHDYERSASSADVCRAIPSWRDHVSESDPNLSVERERRAIPKFSPAPERFAVNDNSRQLERDR